MRANRIARYILRILFFPQDVPTFTFTKQSIFGLIRILWLLWVMQSIMVGSFILGAILILSGEKSNNSVMFNLGIGVVASGIVSFLFLLNDNYSRRVSALRIRINFFDYMTRLLYITIPDQENSSEPMGDYHLSDYLHIQHRLFHDYYKANETVSAQGDQLFRYLRSHILLMEDNIQELFSEYSLLSLERCLETKEYEIVKNFRYLFHRISKNVQSSDELTSIYYYAEFLDNLSHMIKSIRELKVLDKIIATLNENGQVTFDRDEFYSSEPNIEYADKFAAIRIENYEKMRKNAATNQATSDGQDGE